jgi:hypothetical protein
MARRNLYPLSLLVLLLSVNAAAVPKECGTTESPRGERFEIGMLYQALIPSGLPGLTRTVPIYGPILGVPLLGGTLQVQGVFGSDSSINLNLTLLEATYRVEIEFPYFNAFALFGAPYLRYAQTTTHAAFGANLGVGISFLMGKNLELSLALRTYLQQRSTISFGGGFSFLL